MPKVYITEYKNIYKINLPQEWKIYHYYRNCSGLTENEKHFTVVEKDAEELDKIGFRCCAHQGCLSLQYEHLIAEGKLDEDGPPFLPELSAEELAKKANENMMGKK